MEKVSIVVPVYNSAKYLDQCIQSLVHQSYPAIEIILVNDGSSDNSLDIINHWEKQDSRLICISQKNQGVTCARKNGTRIATGKWICFVDSDDEIPHNAIEAMISNSKNVELVIGAVNAEGRKHWNFPRFCADYSKNEYLIDLLKEEKIHWGPVAKLFQKKLLDDFVFDIPRKITNGEDFIFNLRVACKVKNVRIIDSIVYQYISRDGSASSKDPFLSISYCWHFEKEVWRSIKHLKGTENLLAREHIKRSIYRRFEHLQHAQKKRIKRHIKQVLKFIFTKFFKTKYIIFESFPELGGSPWMIYQEMKRRGYGKTYKLIWFVEKGFKTDLAVTCNAFGKLTFLEKIRKAMLTAQAKLIIDSNRAIRKNNTKTIRLFTRHGGCLKYVPAYIHNLGQMDYMLVLSPEMQKVQFQELGGHSVDSIEQILPLGFPANDQIFEKVDLFSNGFYPRHLKNTNQRFSKIIGWLPTYRQHRLWQSQDDESDLFPFGVPLIRSEEELRSLNQFLTEKNILLAIQIHHAQASNFAKLKFSNIILISQKIKYEMNISLITLMQSFDAMITDYSAAYYEYLLLNRPVALSIDDFEEYSSNVGFCLNYFDWIKGVYLKTVKDLTKFISDVSNNIDSAKLEREGALHRIHQHIDNRSSQRVVDFLAEKAKL